MIKYELIEELFLPETVSGEEDTGLQASLRKNSNISKNKGFSRIFLDNLEDQSLFLTGNLEGEEFDRDLQAGWFKRIFTIRRRPSETPRGHVFVENTTKGGWDPVIGVKVKTRRWFWWGHGWTNGDGWYHGNTSYRNPVHYEIVFKNTRGFKVWSTFVTISSARYNVGKFDSEHHDFYIHRDQRAWRFATVNNAAEYYFRYCDELGIGHPPGDMRITALNSSEDSSAPMLNKVNTSLFSSNSIKLYISKKHGIKLGVSSIISLMKFAVPDLIISASPSLKTAEIYETVFHEMSHASHFAQVGSRYWTRYINYILRYGSYGDGSGDDSDLVALGEMWAYYMGYYLTLKHFGDDNGLVKPEALEDFEPVERPREIDISRPKDKNYPYAINSMKGWIPVGLVHDLVDSNVDLVRPGYYDRVSGYTLSQIFWSMRPGVESIQALRDKLLQNNDYRQSEEVKRLFEAYYYK